MRALLFGLTIAAPVGPIALLRVHIGLNHRLGEALLVALGVAAADLSYAVVALTVGAVLSSGLSAHRLELQIFSSLVLLALGTWLARKALRGLPTADPLAERVPGMGRLYVPTMANPLTIVLFVVFAGQLRATGIAEIVVDALVWIIHEGLGVGLRHVTACGRLREQPAAARPRP